MKKLIIGIALSLLLSVQAYGTTLTGSILYPSGAGVTGRLLMHLVIQGALSSAGSCGGPAFLVPTTDTIFTLTNGSLPGGATIDGNDCISPANTYYIVTVRDSNNNVLFQDNWYISGSTINVGTITPDVNPPSFAGAVLLSPPFNLVQSIASGLQPATDNTYDLGSYTAGVPLHWNYGWFNYLQTQYQYRLGNQSGAGGLEMAFLDSTKLAFGDPFTGTGKWPGIEFFPGTATSQFNIDGGGPQWPTVGTAPTGTSGTGRIYFDGTNFQVIQGTAAAVQLLGGSGNIGGSGTAGTIPVFTGSTAIGNGSILDNGSYFVQINPSSYNFAASSPTIGISQIGSANDTSQAAVFVEQAISTITSSPTPYEKMGILTQCETVDPSTLSINRDCVGIDARGTAFTTKLAHVWGLYAQAGGDQSTGGDGVMVGAEIGVMNYGADEPLIDQTDSKYGITLVGGEQSPGGNPSTAAISITNANSLYWHTGLIGRANAVGGAAGDAFIQLLDAGDFNGVFRVANTGITTVGTLTPDDTSQDMLEAYASHTNGTITIDRNSNSGSTAYAAFVAREGSATTNNSIAMGVTSIGYATTGGIAALQGFVTVGTAATGGMVYSTQAAAPHIFEIDSIEAFRMTPDPMFQITESYTGVNVSAAGAVAFRNNSGVLQVSQNAGAWQTIGGQFFNRATDPQGGGITDITPATLSDRVIVGQASSDIAQQYTLISNGAVYVVDATANAHVGGVVYDSGSGTIRVVSGITGSATAVPLAFVTYNGSANIEGMRLDTSTKPNLLIGLTTADDTVQLPVELYRSNTSGTSYLVRNDNTATTAYASYVARAGASGSQNNVATGVTGTNYTTASGLTALQGFVTTGTGSTAGLVIQTQANAPIIVQPHEVATAQFNGNGVSSFTGEISAVSTTVTHPSSGTAVDMYMDPNGVSAGVPGGALVSNTWGGNLQQMFYNARNHQFYVGTGAYTASTVMLNIASGGEVDINNVHYIWPSAQAGASSYVLTNDGAGNLSWGAGGGGASGISGATNNGLMYATGATTGTSSGAATNGQVLIGSTGTTPVVATITGTSGQLTVTNGAGSITLAIPTVQRVSDGSFNDVQNVTTADRLVWGLASSDITLSASGIIAKTQMYVASAASNATVGGIVYISGDPSISFVSGISGAGTAVPMSFKTYNSGATANVEGLHVDTKQNAILGNSYLNSNLAQNATAGYPYVPGVLTGAPTGTPANSYTGFYPMVVDPTDKALYLYIAGSWNNVASGGGGTGISGASNHGIMYATGGTTATSTAAATNGQVLIGSTGNAPALGTITNGGGISISYSSPNIQIALTTITANQVLYGTGGAGYTSSSNYTYNGTDITVATGSLNLSAAGNGVRMGSYEAVAGDATDTQLQFYANNGSNTRTEVAYMNSQRFIFGGASGTSTDFGTATNQIITISNGTGAFFAAATGASNASVMEFGIANGAGVMTIASTRTGAGTYLPIDIDTNGGTAAVISTSQTWQMPHYGAGTATFDSAGNITSSSDERLKFYQRDYTDGLAAVMTLQPVVYKWRPESHMETEHEYAGFFAQNAQAASALAVGQQADGYLTLQDRAILAMLVNAVKEQQAEIAKLKAQIKQQ